MRERPIIFSSPMVKAIIAGRKTMTRRPVKPQPVFEDLLGADIKHYLNICPYGVPGDWLWVKETHYRYGKWIKNGKTKTGQQRWGFKPIGGDSVDFGPFDARPRALVGWHKRPSIFMPRWASRITLEVTDVRVERLQEITPEDCLKEGIEAFEGDGLERLDKFSILWETIYGEYSWDANPWVWVIGLRKI